MHTNRLFHESLAIGELRYLAKCGEVVKREKIVAIRVFIFSSSGLFTSDEPLRCYAINIKGKLSR